MRKWQSKTVSGMMLPLLLLGMLTLVFNVQLVGSLVSPPTVQWTLTYGGTGYDEAHCVIQTSDGGYALAGETYSYGAGSSDYLLVKVDSAGAFDWAQTYGGPNQDRCYSVVQTSDGGYALAGFTYSFGAGQGDFYLVKTNPTGVVDWAYTYGTINDEWCYSLVQTSDGGYALAGFTRFVGATEFDFYLVKTDSTGAVDPGFPKTYGGLNYDFCYSVVQTSDGGYALAGETRSFGAGGSDFWLVKTDSTGAVDPGFPRTYGGLGNEWCYSVIQTSDGGYALAGETDSYGAGNYDFYLVKTDSTGAVDPGFPKTYGGLNWDGASSVVQTSDGGYAMTGWTLSYGAGGWDLWVIKTDPLGNAEWNLTLGGTGDDWGNSLVQTSDGGYALGGATASYGVEGSLDFWLIKLAPPEIVLPRSLDKSMNATSGFPGDIVEVTIIITVPTGETVKVEDTIPMGLKYVWGSFTVDGLTPIYNIVNLSSGAQEISTTITTPGPHIIKFLVKVVGGPGLGEGKLKVKNIADATWYEDATQVDTKQATVDFTIYRKGKGRVFPQ